MAKRFRLDFSTAYGQLILLVFLPISVLAMVGGVLVLYDTSRAARIVQKTHADALLSQSQTLLLGHLDDLILINSNGDKENPKAQKQLEKLIEERKNHINQKLQSHLKNQHLQGWLLLNDKKQVITSFGDNHELEEYLNPKPLTPFNDYQMGNGFSDYVVFQSPHSQIVQNPLPKKSRISQFIDYWTAQNHYLLDTELGTFYDKAIELTAQLTENHQPQKFWVVVNMDNEPLKIARYQVMLALAITGLLTILLLLLSINVYAQRWITPIYEMRLHLQRTNSANLYKPMNIRSSGEINQLQQDLVKTLRRLHSSFQDLKNHAEQSEDDLRRAFDDMEMQNITIRNAHAQAVSASKTKSAFLANISHELRTPLNSIDGFINLLSRHGGLSHEQDLYVQTIRKSSAHLLALVNDVLDFSKIEAGKLVLDNHELDLYATIYDVADMLSPIAAEKALRLAVYFYDDVPRYLLGDALRIKQVLTNLVNNAIKFTDTGEVLIRVSLDDDNDEMLHISVQDTGRGISPEHQKVLFQSFSQGDPSITRQYGGTGLGLIISKQLTTLMGGNIGFFDNSEQQDNSTGSTFWFSLPMTFSPRQEQLFDAPLDKIWEIPPHLWQKQDKPLQLLTFIEHTASLQVLRGSLQPLNVEITIANSLSMLLELLTNHKDWHWLIIDKGVSEDTTSLLKQIRLHYAGKLALFGYHVNLEPNLLNQYQALSLYQPLDRRQLYQLLDNNQQKIVEQILPKWQGFCVLAVDDHLPNLLVLEALLNELGVDVVTVNSGFDAVEYMKNSFTNNTDYRKIDLIFMDIQMPKMSGRQASLQIRQLESLYAKEQQVPIIALTAHSLSDEKEKLLASGINDYVGKPISQSQLIAVLEHWFSADDKALLDPNLIKTNLITTDNPSDIEQNITDELSVIDWQDALDRVAGKQDLARSLLNMLIETSQQEKEELQQAWQAQQRENLAHIAHRILGASRYTGVPQLRQASQTFEDKCLLNVQNTSPTQFAMLAPYFEQLIQALDNLIELNKDDYPMLKTTAKEHEMAWKMI